MGEINFETLDKMKSQDKAKSFDLIVDAVRNDSASAGDKTKEILTWCTQWFG